ncbi:MAG TPA: chain length determinant protein tyrosine kinase EpsG [Burkholderiales bacterium]|nr:chain length determinant protein tyrosine kinase EpsG [Burkholderiales bacterium]
MMTALRDGTKLWPVAAASRSGERSIGALLIDAGKLTPADAERVLRLQREHGLKFGEAAVQLGLVSEQDIQQMLSAQFEYPYLHGQDNGLGPEVIAAYQPFSRQVEQLRALRSQLMLRWFSPERKVLAIISPGRGEGRSYLAANLAVVCSQLGERTLLVDADMRHPRQHRLFDLSDKLGLSTMLSGRRGHEELHRVPGLLDMSVLPAGPSPPNPQELLGRAALADLTRELSAAFDIVIVDTPAAELSADAQVIAVRSGGALLVVRKDRTCLRAVQDLAASVTDTGGRVVGSVLNDF